MLCLGQDFRWTAVFPYLNFISIGTFANSEGNTKSILFLLVKYSFQSQFLVVSVPFLLILVLFL